MYTKQEASAIRQKFWTTFGQYLAPVPSASGEKVHWINYKTGVRSVQVRMDATSSHAYFGIEVADKDQHRQIALFTHLQSLKSEFPTFSKWIWEEEFEAGSKHGGRVYTKLEAVNIFNEGDWPTVISFLKANLIFFDAFWVSNRDIFEMIA